MGRRWQIVGTVPLAWPALEKAALHFSTVCLKGLLVQRAELSQRAASTTPVGLLQPIPVRF